MTFEPATAPAEPVDLRAEIAERTAAGEFTLTDEYDWVVPITEPAPGRIVVGTELAAHCWRAWERELRELGFDYSTFVTLTTYTAESIGEWATGEASWDGVVTALEAQVEALGPTLTADLSP